MGFLGFGKKERVIDLSEKYRRQQEEKLLNQSKIKSSLERKPVQNSPFFGILNSSSNSTQVPMPNDIPTQEENPEEKRKKFMQKFSEMSERLETVSTSLYHLSQRVELLEKKLNVGH